MSATQTNGQKLIETEKNSGEVRKLVACAE